MVTPSWFRKLFQKAEGSDKKLEVRFERILVGVLEYRDGNFLFTYDPECPDEIKIKGIPGPRLQTKHLPPFFTTRLPSRSRPEISEEIRKLKTDDPIYLLGMLSRKSAVSPYKFQLRES